MRVAIIDARWPDVELERRIYGLTEDRPESRSNSEGILLGAFDAEVILKGPRPPMLEAMEVVQ